ncbi:ERG4/ERG24 ergosterol biosynthesis protein [Lentinus brumalis]|uniref:Delta(14)-sterol reductase ERG24 n=1 Tax=Lentinus brumalis TaxID=2498619 RepID=A0A371DLI2_9APHY|nr:ERG4/ERG24 ergosterol biosynthesis protein [Polyporus brumalis]
MTSAEGKTTAGSSELNPRTTQYEFLGPPGALAICIGTPVVMYAMYFGCSEEYGGCSPPVDWAAVAGALTSWRWWRGLWDTQAASLYLAYYGFVVVSWYLLPGKFVQGLPMRNGQVKTYKVNAFASMLLLFGIVAGVLWRHGPQPFTIIYEKWVELLTASTLMSFALALGCYLASFRDGALLALGGNSGNFIYDFFIGRELNPSIGSLDLKSFNELRPGLMLWALVDIAMACTQAVRRGGHITDSMWLVVLFQCWYVADALYNESAVFTTMDITSDGFGFMLALAITIEPFLYSLQARYLVFNPIELGPVYTAMILAVNLLGYYIFRAANGEKNDFRNGRNPKNLQYLTTESGRKLLTSGWWGRSRHPNYMGDLLMALAWSLPTGFNTPLTYFYVIYFTILLVHRQQRDDEACRQKYGKDWEKYKSIVPWRILPYLY